MLRVAVLVASITATACATFGPLSAIVQPPRFSEARDHPAEVELVGPSMTSGLGGANIRLWTTVTNPNPFGFTIASLDGTLYLDGARAATTDFPLGLPLSAGEHTTIPIDFAINFRDIPNLVNVVRRAADRRGIDYRFEGTVSIDAGRLGTPVLGPMTFLRGTID